MGNSPPKRSSRKDSTNIEPSNISEEWCVVDNVLENDASEKSGKLLPRGYLRFPVFFFAERGADTCVGQFQCLVPGNTTLGALKGVVARRVGFLGGGDIDLFDFSGKELDRKRCNLDIESLPRPLRFSAFPSSSFVERSAASSKISSDGEKVEDDVDVKEKNSAVDNHFSSFSVEPPSYLLCPLTKKVFRDPVIVPSGQTYERSAALKLIDPSSGEPFKESECFKNFLVEHALEEWEIEAHPMRSSLSKADLAKIGAKLYRQASRNLDEPPEFLLDPITFELLNDAVCTKFGHTYSRATIEDVLEKFRCDPIARKPLDPDRDIYPNQIVRKMLASFTNQKRQK